MRIVGRKRLPEERNLNQILRPPHGGGLHQIPPEQPGPPESQHLRRHHNHQRQKEAQIPLVEHLHRAHNMDRVHVIHPRVGEDRDQNVLLHVERPRIKRELQPPPLEEHSIGDRRRHEVANRNHRDLSRDRRERHGLFPVPEELLEERQDDAGNDPEGPRSEGDGREGGIVRDRNGKSDLFDRRILPGRWRGGARGGSMIGFGGFVALRNCGGRRM